MIEIGLGHYLVLAAIIFTIGIIGIFLNRKNVIIILMSIELILLAGNINLVSFSFYLQNLCQSYIKLTYCKIYFAVFKYFLTLYLRGLIN